MGRIFIITGWLLFVLAAKPSAQTIIKGVVTDTALNPLSGVSITSTGTNPAGAIKAFAITNNKGNYQLIVDDAVGDTLYLTFSFVGFSPQRRQVKNKAQTLNVRLATAIAALPEVKLKNVPVSLYKDTLNYDVTKFKTADDRVIGDVLKKMPGIDVLSSGQINYQGKPIQQLTVEGLNLMEGQYGIISKNLNADAVAKVQVVENDQRIKILDSLVPSNLTTINLKLKKYAISGVLEAGLGLTPLLRTINITPMVFNKNTQMIHSYISNNTGNDAAEQLSMLPVGASLYNTNNARLTRITGIVGAPVPPFQKNRWLNNSLNLLSSNYLQKLPNNWIAKLNIGYINDYQQQVASGVTTFYVPGQPAITISEAQTNALNSNIAMGNAVLEKNTKKLFFRNVLSTNHQWNADVGNLQNNSLAVNQQNNYRTSYLNNRLTLTTAIGRQLVTINSLFGYGVLPEQLQVSPGPFQNVLNDSLFYQKAVQQVTSKATVFNNSAAITKKIAGLTIGITAGWQGSRTNLTSGLQTVLISNEVKSPDSLRNNLQVWQNAFYTNLSANRTFGKASIMLNLPLKYAQLQTRYGATNKTSNLLVQPSVYADYKINSQYKSYVSLQRTDTFVTNVSSLYTRFILTNYRTLQQYPAIFARTTSHSGNAGIEFKNPLSGLFWSVNYEADRTRNNVLYSNFIFTDGRSAVVGSELPNVQTSHTLSFNGSKLIAPVSTIVKLTARGMLNRYQRIINNTLVTPGNRALVIQPSIVNNASSIISVSYVGNFVFRNSFTGNGSSRNLFQHNHQLQTNITLAKGHSVNLNYDLYNFNQPGYNAQPFLDMRYRCSIGKNKKTDLEINCTNIFNRSVFASFYNDGFTSFSNTFLLRQRQTVVMVRKRF